MTPVESSDSAPVVTTVLAAEAAGDWDQILVVLDHNWADLMRTDVDWLAGLLGRMPETVMVKNPRWALSIRYIERLQGGGSSRTLRVSTNVPLGEGAGLVDRLADLTSRAAQRRSVGNFAAAVALVDEARTLVELESDDPAPADAMALSELYHQWGRLRELASDVFGAAGDYRTSYDFARATGNVRAEYGSAAGLAWIYALVGSRGESQIWLDSLPSDGQGEWWVSRPALPAQLARALLLVDEFKLPEAIAVLEKVDLSASPDSWSGYYYVRAKAVRRSQNAWSQLSDIDSRTGAMPAALVSGGLNGILIGIARAILFTAVGRPALAMEAVERYSQPRGVEGLAAVCLATVQMMQGDRAATFQIATAVLGSGVTIPRVISVAELLLAVSTDDVESARIAADHAIEIAARERLLSGLANVPREYLDPILGTRVGQLGEEAVENILAVALSRPLLSALESLTTRERAVAAAAANGASIAEIAEQLFVSPNTVKSQLRGVYRKLGLSSREDLAREGRRYGFR